MKKKTIENIQTDILKYIFVYTSMYIVHFNIYIHIPIYVYVPHSGYIR